VLTVPDTGVVLPLLVPLPAGTAPRIGRAFELVDRASPGEPVPAVAVPAPAADGSVAPGSWRLAVTVPRRSAATAPRRFELRLASGARPERRGFVFKEVSDRSLGLWEGDRPVLVYNHGVMSRAGVPADRNRSTYVHPLYGLDGEVLSDDFPEDHYHHRGLFWAWPHVKAGGQEYDLWTIKGLHQRFERWLVREAGPRAAVLAVENGWYAGNTRLMTERVWLCVYAADGDAQSVDLAYYWMPVGGPVTLAGAEGKSYGGLTLRYAPRTNTVITTPLGPGTNDLQMTALPWADLSGRFEGAIAPSGAAIFVDPRHPDYPPTWLTRHYGALCLGWPGVKERTFPTGEPIYCAYRLWIHRGVPTPRTLAQAYDGYRAGREARWE
jgi:hypothetical protein